METERSRLVRGMEDSIIKEFSNKKTPIDLYQGGDKSIEKDDHFWKVIEMINESYDTSPIRENMNNSGQEQQL